jgi:hypothetical protein
MAAEQFPLFEALKALDSRDKDYWSRLGEEQKKKFSPYLLLRWASAVERQRPEIEEWYVDETNRSVNINFWSLTRHPKLLWMLFSQVGTGIRGVRHEYIKRNQDRKDPQLALLMELYPSMKRSDLELLKKITPPEEFKEWLDEYEEFKREFDGTHL